MDIIILVPTSKFYSEDLRRINVKEQISFRHKKCAQEILALCTTKIHTSISMYACMQIHRRCVEGYCIA